MFYGLILQPMKRSYVDNCKLLVQYVDAIPIFEALDLCHHHAQIIMLFSYVLFKIEKLQLLMHSIDMNGF